MITLALLSGGRSVRMRQDKALMPFLGRPLIQRILERLVGVAGEIVLSTNHPAEYAFLGLPCYTDLQPDCGALGGLYTALTAARGSLVAAVACDMPFANPALFEYECDLLAKTGADVAIPSLPEGPEPLHAVYRRETCLPVIQSAIISGNLKMTGWLDQAHVRAILPEEVRGLDPSGLAFLNLNTPADFRQAEERARSE